MEPNIPGNDPLRQPLPQQPQLQEPVQTGEMQIDKSTANPMPIVAALIIMAAIVLGWVLLADPQGTQTASNTAAPPASDPVRTIEPKSVPNNATEQGAREKTEPEK